MNQLFWIAFAVGVVWIASCTLIAISYARSR
jgi:hypothetical protein